MPYDYPQFSSTPYIVSVILTIIAVCAAITCTVLLMVLVLPENKREKLPSFFKFVADIFNFKSLLLEKILKVLYIFLTLFLMFNGFLSIFTSPIAGLLQLILGPVIIRISFEAAMMFILLVKNVIEINQKLKNNNDTDNESK